MKATALLLTILLSFSVSAQKRKKRSPQNYPVRIECIDAYDMKRMAGVRLYSNSIFVGESDSLGILNAKISVPSGKAQLTLVDANNLRDSVKIEDYLSSLINNYQIRLYPNDKFEELIWTKEDSLYGSISRAEMTSKSIDEFPVVGFSDTTAQFIGGQNALSDYLNDQMDFSRLPQTNAKAYIRFVIESDGVISHILCQNDVPVKIRQEAIRVVRQMPEWKPGNQNVTAIRTMVQLPIVFTFK